MGSNMMQPLGMGRRNLGLLIATGQLTQYSSELDDGYYKKGIAKSYTIMTSGVNSGSTYVYLAHYIGADIGFVNNNPSSDTITSATIDFTTLFKPGDVIRISGATNPANNSTWTIKAAGVAAHVITITQANVLTTEAAGATVTIEKREDFSNECVFDNNTGLTWLRYPSQKLGGGSNGRMPWTGALYSVFAFCAAVNIAAVGGISTFRVPNVVEVSGLLVPEAPVIVLSSPEFPVSSYYFWSSTTVGTETNKAFTVGYGGFAGNSLKTSQFALGLLVSGG
jgi:hypothetical protein